MRTETSAEAQNHVGMLLDNTPREPIPATRRGLLAAFRASGKGGSAARLVAEHEAERKREAIQVHKDPEFEKVADLKQESLPYK